MRNIMVWVTAWRCLQSRRAEMYLQHFGLRHPPLGKNLTPLWIIDEAQNLPAEFFRDFPSFLNFVSPQQ